MKRFWLIIFLGLVVFVSLDFGANISLLNLCDESTQISSYSIATYKEFNFENCTQIDDLKIYDFDLEFFLKDEYLDNCVAEMIEIECCNFDQIDYFKNLPRVKFENVSNIEFIYLYDESLPKILEVDGTRFNLQIAITENLIKVGYPCIVDSI